MRSHPLSYSIPATKDRTLLHKTDNSPFASNTYSRSQRDESSSPPFGNRPFSESTRSIPACSDWWNARQPRRNGQADEMMCEVLPLQNSHIPHRGGYCWKCRKNGPVGSRTGQKPTGHASRVFFGCSNVGQTLLWPMETWMKESAFPRKMRESWEHGDLWVNYGARKSWAFDDVWPMIDAKLFGNNTSVHSEEKLELLEDEDRKVMGPFVQKKLEDSKQRKLDDWDV